MIWSNPLQFQLYHCLFSPTFLSSEEALGGGARAQVKQILINRARILYRPQDRALSHVWKMYRISTSPPPCTEAAWDPQKSAAHPSASSVKATNDGAIRVDPLSRALSCPVARRGKTSDDAPLRRDLPTDHFKQWWLYNQIWGLPHVQGRCPRCPIPILWRAWTISTRLTHQVTKRKHSSLDHTGSGPQTL